MKLDPFKIIVLFMSFFATVSRGADVLSDEYKAIELINQTDEYIIAEPLGSSWPIVEISIAKYILVANLESDSSEQVLLSVDLENRAVTVLSKVYYEAYQQELSKIQLNDDLITDIVFQQKSSALDGALPDIHTIVLISDKENSYKQILNEMSLMEIEFRDIDNDGELDMVEYSDSLGLGIIDTFWPEIYILENDDFLYSEKYYPLFHQALKESYLNKVLSYTERISDNSMTAGIGNIIIEALEENITRINNYTVTNAQ